MISREEKQDTGLVKRFRVQIQPVHPIFSSAAQGVLRSVKGRTQTVSDINPGNPTFQNEPPAASASAAAAGTAYSTSPIDGLAMALQAYTADEALSFSTGAEGMSFNVLDDAKDKIKDVVVSLNNALVNLSKKLEQATSEIATLEVVTGEVADLDTFDPNTADRLIVTRVSASGDIQVFVSRDGPAIDEDLLALHQGMVKQALTNRMEVARAVADMIAGLFGAKK
jgi:hypothetical protein